jgi:hypothetical protein
MKTLTVRQMAAVKRVAQNVNPDVTKRNKLVEKINELATEVDTLNKRIDSYELGIKAITGGYTSEDLVVKTVKDTGKVGKDGKPIKATTYEPAAHVVFNEETKLYEIHETSLAEVAASEVDNEASVDMVATTHSQVDEAIETTGFMSVEE